MVNAAGAVVVVVPLEPELFFELLPHPVIKPAAATTATSAANDLIGLIPILHRTTVCVRSMFRCVTP
jgi:hypothetical protein